MSNGKMGKYMLLGALIGATMSLLDRGTRYKVQNTYRDMVSGASFYKQNPDVLKLKFDEQKQKLQTVYNQISEDAAYLKTQMEELKALTPQVKELVLGTKEAFVESKDEYKSIVAENSSTPLQ